MHSCLAIGLAALALCGADVTHASTVTFDTDPFAGTNVLNAPGRQIVGGESFINFFVESDRLAFDAAVYGVPGPLAFANGRASSLGLTSANVIVLNDLDDDGNALTPFGASNAANLIAPHMAAAGPGFFVYFNQSLDLPRLVYSADLSSTGADLRILARVLNLNGSSGVATLPSLSAGNFEFVDGHTASVPEPASAWLAAAALGLCAIVSRPRRRA